MGYRLPTLAITKTSEGSTDCAARCMGGLHDAHAFHLLVFTLRSCLHGGSENYVAPPSGHGGFAPDMFRPA
jgi:hypothetical protein